MSDGFGAVLLMSQLGEQHRAMLDRDNLAQANLIFQNQQLVADYNKLAARFNALDRSAREAQAAASARIAELERLLASEEASAAHWRWRYGEVFKSTLPK